MRILLSGYNGAMGRVITELFKENELYKIVVGYSRTKTEGFDFPVYNNIFEIEEELDVIIDFSNVEALTDILKYGVDKKLPMVIASTGLGDEEYEKISQASLYVPIIQAGNMSLGINTLLDMVGKLARSLKEFDIEIIEKHHRYKVDSPSGTAQMLVEAVKSGREDVGRLVHGRQGNQCSRQDGEVGVLSVRGGTIVGEHSVIFAGIDEMIEIKHTASSKRIFAYGAMKAGDFIVGKPKGLYSMRDVIE